MHHPLLIVGFFSLLFFSGVFCNTTKALGSEPVSITDEKVLKFWKENLSRIKDCVLNSVCYRNTESALPDDARDFKLTKAWRRHPLIGSHGYYFHFQVTFVVQSVPVKPRLIETFIYDDPSRPLTAHDVHDGALVQSK